MSRKPTFTWQAWDERKEPWLVPEEGWHLMLEECRGHDFYGYTCNWVIAHNTGGYWRFKETFLYGHEAMPVSAERDAIKPDFEEVMPIQVTRYTRKRPL